LSMSSASFTSPRNTRTRSKIPRSAWR
jgi:hypothetical protein